MSSRGRGSPTTVDNPRETLMDRQLRGWGFVLLARGLLEGSAWALVTRNMLADFVTLPLAILYILAGIMVFPFRDRSLFVVFALTVFWGAVPRLFVLTEMNASALILEAIYLLVTVFLLSRFFHFRDVASARDKGRSAEFFPLIAAIAGVIGLTGTAVFWAGGGFGIVQGLAIQIGVMGFSVGVAALLAQHPRRPLVLVGIATGMLVVGAWIYSFLLASYAPDLVLLPF